MKPTGKIEQDYVVSLGWIDEGIAWRVERGASRSSG